YINKALLGLLDTIYIVYLNNIITRRRRDDDTTTTRNHVTSVHIFRHYINLKKCIFYTTSINFLGFIISVNKVLMEKS
ncbi:uncharacterized protein K441DRAFT_537157, partial [Cenococcum geophilum 1.58]|uniref:uncharacterized protein n=1 Tax=Cenococcum geophilum 1.58 TaxID=794803 RepID=UPI00358EF885